MVTSSLAYAGTEGKVEVQFQTIRSLGSRRGEWSVPRPGRFIPGKDPEEIENYIDAYDFLVVYLEGKKQSGDLDVDGKILISGYSRNRV
jgi:hypothetical protein